MEQQDNAFPNIVLNGQAPAHGDPDVLWDLIHWLLIMVADRAKQFRYESGPKRVRVRYRVAGCYYEMCEPFWRPHDVKRRLSDIFVNSEDSLWRKAQAALRGWVSWTRRFCLHVNEYKAAGTCRYRCTPSRMSLEFSLDGVDEYIVTNAGELAASWSEHIPHDEMFAEFMLRE